jgi:deoxyadenosine/deoxycytidine kinase
VPAPAQEAALSEARDRPRIAIVGPCAAGKSTLAISLRRLGCDVHHVAQEHSYVPNMWQVMTRPDWLVFLDASYPVSTRRKHLRWTEAEYMAEQARLAHARQNCDVYLLTDELTPQEVLRQVLQALGLDAPPESSG